LAVIVLISTTKAYIAPAGTSTITIATAGGTDKIHAGSRNQASAIADAGNIKFAPDEPTLTAAAGGSLADNKTYYYRVSAKFGADESLAGPSRRSRFRTAPATRRSASAGIPSRVRPAM